MSKEMVLSPVYQLSEALRKCARRLELHSVGACDAFDCEKLLEYANNVFHQNQVELSVFGTSSVGKSTVLNSVMESDIQLLTESQIRDGHEFIKSKTPEITHESIYSLSLVSEEDHNDPDWNKLFFEDNGNINIEYLGYLLPEGTGNTTLIPCKLKYSPSFQIKFHIRSKAQVQDLVQSVPMITDDEALDQGSDIDDDDSNYVDNPVGDSITGIKQLVMSMMGSKSLETNVRVLTRSEVKFPMSMKKWVKAQPSILTFTSPFDNISDSVAYIKKKYAQYLLSNNSISGFFTIVEICVPATTLRYGTLVDVPGFASLHFDLQRQIDQTLRDSSGVIMFLKPEPYSGENYSSVHPLFYKLVGNEFADYLYENGDTSRIDRLTKATNLMIVVNPGSAQSYKKLENIDPVMESDEFMTANENLKQQHLTVLRDKLLLPIFIKEFKGIKRPKLTESRDVFINKINTKGFPVTYTQIYPIHNTHHNSGMYSFKQQIKKLFVEKSCHLFDYVTDTILPFLENVWDKAMIPKQMSSSAFTQQRAFWETFCSSLVPQTLYLRVLEYIKEKLNAFNFTLGEQKMDEAYWTKVHNMYQEKFNEPLNKEKRFVVTNAFSKHGGRLKDPIGRCKTLAFEDVMFSDFDNIIIENIDSIRDFIVNVFKDDKKRLRDIFEKESYDLNIDLFTHIINTAETQFHTYEEEASKFYKPTDTIRDTERTSIRQSIETLVKHFFDKIVKKSVKATVKENKLSNKPKKIALYKCSEECMRLKLPELKNSIHQLLTKRIETEMAHLSPLLQTSCIALRSLENTDSLSSYSNASLKPFRKVWRKVLRAIIEQYNSILLEHSKGEGKEQGINTSLEKLTIVKKIQSVKQSYREKTALDLAIINTNDNNISPVTTTPITTTTTTITVPATPTTVIPIPTVTAELPSSTTTIPSIPLVSRSEVVLESTDIIVRPDKKYYCSICQFTTNCKQTYSAHFKRLSHREKLPADVLANLIKKREAKKTLKHLKTLENSRKRTIDQVDFDASTELDQSSNNETESKQSGPPRKRRKTVRSILPDLETMIARNLLPPLSEGITVWTCHIKSNETITATITSTGKIVYNGIEYYSPSKFVNTVLGTKTYSGYHYLMIGGITLNDMRITAEAKEKLLIPAHVPVSAPTTALTTPPSTTLVLTSKTPITPTLDINPNNTFKPPLLFPLINYTGNQSSHLGFSRIFPYTQYLSPASYYIQHTRNNNTLLSNTGNHSIRNNNNNPNITTNTSNTTNTNYFSVFTVFPNVTSTNHIAPRTTPPSSSSL